MVVLNVIYKAVSENLEEFLEAVYTEGLDEASRNEEGNIKYDYYFPADNGDELLLVEKWRDEAAFEQHKSEPHFKRLGELKDSLGIETVMDIFTV